MDDFRQRMTDEILRLVLGGHFDRFLLQCMYCRLNHCNFWTSGWILDFLGSAPIFVTMIYIFFLVNFFFRASFMPFVTGGHVRRYLLLFIYCDIFGSNSRNMQYIKKKLMCSAPPFTGVIYNLFGSNWHFEQLFEKFVFFEGSSVILFFIVILGSNERI